MSQSDKKYTLLIIAGSIAIPFVVAILYFTPRIDSGALDFSFLPAVNASINALCTLVLLSGFWAIVNKKVQLHQNLMTAALVLSILFLLSYVTYHATNDSTKFGGEGTIRYVYFFILLSHILLSAAIVPMVLITYVRALNKRFDKHRKLARITLPIWLYVTTTGVIVYFMISPYY